jgi:uncharacterized Zn finger protein (UPF0148 family)
MSKSRKIWRFKGCHRCGGDLFRDDTVKAGEFTCLQCGEIDTLMRVDVGERETKIDNPPRSPSNPAPD